MYFVAAITPGGGVGSGSGVGTRPFKNEYFLFEAELGLDVGMIEFKRRLSAEAGVDLGATGIAAGGFGLGVGSDCTGRGGATDLDGDSPFGPSEARGFGPGEPLTGCGDADGTGLGTLTCWTEPTVAAGRGVAMARIGACVAAMALGCGRGVAGSFLGWTVG